MGSRRNDANALPLELIDWPRRLAREQDLIERVLAEAPTPRVLDLGCGTGRHARFLAERGLEVVAIDGSETAIDAAQAEPIPGGLQFILGDIGAVERTVRGHFGAALCLGNTLSQLLSPESVSRMLIGLKRRLIPGAPLLVQSLNYDRLGIGDVETLPIEIVPSADDNLVVVPLVSQRDDGIVLHTTTVLRHRSAGDPVMEIVDTRRAQLRGWKHGELRAMLDVARLSIREVYGDMSGSAYDPARSAELVLVAVS